MAAAKIQYFDVPSVGYAPLGPVNPPPDFPPIRLYSLSQLLDLPLMVYSLADIIAGMNRNPSGKIRFPGQLVFTQKVYRLLKPETSGRDQRPVILDECVHLGALVDDKSVLCQNLNPAQKSCLELIVDFLALVERDNAPYVAAPAPPPPVKVVNFKRPADQEDPEVTISRKVDTAKSKRREQRKQQRHKQQQQHQQSGAQKCPRSSYPPPPPPSSPAGIPVPNPPEYTSSQESSQEEELIGFGQVGRTPYPWETKSKETRLYSTDEMMELYAGQDGEFGPSVEKEIEIETMDGNIIGRVFTALYNGNLHNVDLKSWASELALLPGPFTDATLRVYNYKLWLTVCDCANPKTVTDEEIHAVCDAPPGRCRVTINPV